MITLTIILYNLKLDPFLRMNSSLEGTSKWVLSCSNLSDRNRLCEFFSACETLTSAMNNALTGLWSDSFDSPLLYWSCFKPLPFHMIRSHLKRTTRIKISFCCFVLNMIMSCYMFGERKMTADTFLNYDPKSILYVILFHYTPILSFTILLFNNSCILF